MSNIIISNQNTPALLRFLAAQRQLYSEAKVSQLWEIFFAILVVMVFSVISNLFSSTTVYNALYSILILVIDLLFFEPKIKNLKERAAIIQEYFDCELFDLRWNLAQVGEKPDTDEVELAYQKFLQKGGDIEVLKNWYPKELEAFPLELARLGCQKINCWWDSNLRTTYNFVILTIAIILTVIVVLLAINGNASLAEFILSLVALAPIYNFFFKQHSENNSAAKTEVNLKKFVNKAWLVLKTAIEPNNLTNISRDLQNEIFNYRKNNPLVPDFFYFFFRTQYEDQTKFVVNDLIKSSPSTLDK